MECLSCPPRSTAGRPVRSLQRCPRGYSPDPNLSPCTWNAWTHTLKMLTEKASVTCTRSSALHLYEFPMEA